jgi:hypothetical protein
MTLYTSADLFHRVSDCQMFTIRTVAHLEDTAPAGATHPLSYERTRRQNQRRALARSLLLTPAGCPSRRRCVYYFCLCLQSFRHYAGCSTSLFERNRTPTKATGINRQTEDIRCGASIESQHCMAAAGTQSYALTFRVSSRARRRSETAVAEGEGRSPAATGRSASRLKSRKDAVIVQREMEFWAFGVGTGLG